MGKILGRRTAALLTATLSIGVAAGTVAAAPAHAADVTVTGTIKTFKGAPGSGVQIAFCNSDCFTGGSPAGTAYLNSAGGYTAAVPAGTYAIAVVRLSRLPEYDQAPSSGFLRKEANGQWSVVDTFAAATKQAVSTTAQAITLANGIHNPQNKFTQSTTGTVGYLPCAGHTTTFKPTPFGDLPANGRVAYQWYAGTSTSTMTPIAGARGTSFRPGAALVGQSLYVSMIASAPGRINYDQIGRIGSVGNPVTCTPKLAAMKKSWIKSYGKKKGKAKVGKKVAVSGAKAASKKYRLKVSYSWMLNGRAVAAGKKYKIPAAAKKQKLTVKVTFSRAGYKARSKVITFGRVK